MFTVSLPGNVASFIAQPKEERRATYKRWWIATKKEANHYWVSCRHYPCSACPKMVMQTYLLMNCLGSAMQVIVLLQSILNCACAMQSGTKLLYAEVKIALRLIKKTLHGHSLTRSAFQTLWLLSQVHAVNILIP